jgi:MFS transporter, OFA family, oxalate/formate antiporter
LPEQRSEFAIGGKPLAAAFFGTMCGASPLPFNVLPLVLGPIHAETGWDFAVIAGGVTVFGIIASLLAPAYGAASDKYGVRPVALWSLFLFVLMFSLMALLPSSLKDMGQSGIYLYLAIWALIGLVGIGSTPVTWSRAVSLWFAKNRGLALGLMLIGTSVAGAVVPQIAKPVIENPDLGWRMAFPIVALLPLLLALPIAFAWFREPRPEERPAAVQDGMGNITGLTLKEAFRNYRFWVLFLSILIIALAYGGAHIHMAEIAKIHGHPQAIANILGLVALGILSGRLIVGFLFDRFWAPGIAFPALLLPTLACYLLMGSSTDLNILLLGAFLLGFAAGAESDVIAFLAARYFGMAHYGKIYGFLYIPFGLGSALSPIIYGKVRDVTGSYDPMLFAAIFMFSIGGAMLLLLGKYPEQRNAAQEVFA